MLNVEFNYAGHTKINWYVSGKLLIMNLELSGL